MKKWKTEQVLTNNHGYKTYVVRDVDSISDDDAFFEALKEALDGDWDAREAVMNHLRSI